MVPSKNKENFLFFKKSKLKKKRHSCDSCCAKYFLVLMGLVFTSCLLNPQKNHAEIASSRPAMLEQLKNKFQQAAYRGQDQSLSMQTNRTKQVSKRFSILQKHAKTERRNIPNISVLFFRVYQAGLFGRSKWEVFFSALVWNYFVQALLI